MKKWYQNKKVWILAGGIVVLAGIGGFVATHVKLYQDGFASVSIIGGADGPTSIFLAGKLPGHGSQDQNISTLPLDITMRVVDYKDGILTVEIDNHSGYEMEYGNEYSLQKLEGEEWVEVKPKQEYGWMDIAHIIPDLTVNTETYDLTPFGTLSPGKYKLVKDDLEAEFELTEEE